MWDGCADRGAQRMAVRTAVRTEGPRGRDWLAACRLTLSANGILVTDLPPGNKVGYNPFTPKSVLLSIFFGHIESIENLPGVETHWQNTLLDYKFLQVRDELVHPCTGNSVQHSLLSIEQLNISCFLLNE